MRLDRRAASGERRSKLLEQVGLDFERRVFVDETGTTPVLSVCLGKQPKGPA